MAPCNPPLNFVANGAPGSAFPAPLDPTDTPTIDTNPGFGDLASSYLDALDPATDGSDQIASDAAAAADALDTVGTAMDATLDSILVLLDQAQPGPVDSALDTFAGAQPGAQGFVDGVNGVDVPAIGSIPLTLPNGGATLTFGGSPATGGVPTAGSQPYTLHLRVLPAGAGVHQVRALNLVGPNPPFVGVETGLGPMVVETAADGRQYWVALVDINPAQAGQFTATLYYAADVTITGISGTVQRTLPFEVVVQ